MLTARLTALCAEEAAAVSLLKYHILELASTPLPLLSFYDFGERCDR